MSNDLKFKLFDNRHLYVECQIDMNVDHKAV